MKFKWTNLFIFLFYLLAACSTTPNKADSGNFKPQKNLIERNASEVFARYCSNGKPKRSMRISIKARINEPEKANQSLQSYSEELKSYKSKMRTAIKYIFLRGRIPKEVTRIKEDFVPLGQDSETNIYGDFIYPYLRYANYYLDGRRIKFDPEFDQTLYDIEKLRTGIALRIPVADQHKLFVGLRTPSCIYGEKTSAQLGIGYAFDNTAACLQDGGTINMSPKCTTHFSSDQAIKDQSTSWELVVEQGTSVQESPDQEALTYNYSINLDLGIVCAYGLAINSFKVQF